MKVDDNEDLYVLPAPREVKSINELSVGDYVQFLDKPPYKIKEIKAPVGRGASVRCILYFHERQCEWAVNLNRNPTFLVAKVMRVRSLYVGKGVRAVRL